MSKFLNLDNKWDKFSLVNLTLLEDSYSYRCLILENKNGILDTILIPSPFDSGLFERKLIPTNSIKNINIENLGKNVYENLDLIRGELFNAKEDLLNEMQNTPPDKVVTFKHPVCRTINVLSICKQRLEKVTKNQTIFNEIQEYVESKAKNAEL